MSGLADAAPRSRGRKSRVQDIDRHVGLRMRHRRVLLGMTQTQLAERIGVTYQQAHKYEKGINRISAGALYRIACTLGVEINYFFEGFQSDEVAPIRAHQTPQQRLLLELARSFVGIKSRDHQEAVYRLARAMSDRG